MKIFVLLVSLSMSVFAAKPTSAEQKLLAKTWYVCCLACDDTGQVNYHLKAKKVSSNAGRAVPNGVMREMRLHFRCPKKHEFYCPGPEQFVPAIRAEESK